MDTPQEIDFSVFDELPRQPSWVLVLDKIVFAFIPVGLIGAYLYYYDNFAADPTFMLKFVVVSMGAIMAIIILLVTYKISKTYSLNTKIPATLEKFAQTNDFTYLRELEVGENQHASLFSEFGGHEFRNGIEGNLVGYDFQLVDCSYYHAPVGTKYLFMNVKMMQITLPKTLPNIAIRCNVLSDHPGKTDHPNYQIETIYGEDLRKVEFHDRFSEYFEAFAAGKDAEEFLRKVGPGLIAKLHSLQAFCDIEIAEDTMNIYWDDMTVSRENYENIFSIASTLLSDIGGQLIDDDSVSSSEDAQSADQSTHLDGDLNTDKSHTITYKTIAIFALVVAGFGFGMSFIYQNTTSLEWLGSIPAYMIVPTLLFVVAGYALYSNYRSQKTAKKLKEKYHKDIR